jgi:hypothetical protein
MIRDHLGCFALGASGLSWQRGRIGRMLMPRWRVMKWPVPLPYAACVIGGLMVGLIFGDPVFPSFEKAIGDPLADLLLGIGGGLYAGMVYEIASEIRAIFSWPPRSESSRAPSG